MKEIMSATERKALKGPMKVSRNCMWVDLINMEAVKEKLNGKPDKILLEL